MAGALTKDEAARAAEVRTASHGSRNVAGRSRNAASAWIGQRDRRRSSRKAPARLRGLEAVLARRERKSAARASLKAASSFRRRRGRPWGPSLVGSAQRQVTPSQGRVGLAVVGAGCEKCVVCRKGRSSRARGLPRRKALTSLAMPWISDDIEDWEELFEEERQAIRALLADLGLDCPDDEDDDYYE